MSALTHYHYDINVLVPGLYAPSASVQVNNLDGSAATLYTGASTNSLTLTNPIIASLDGTFQFWAATLVYQYVITTRTGVSYTVPLQSASPNRVALTSVSNSTAIDLSLSTSFSMTMTEDTTLAAPSNAVADQAGQIVITQDASSAYTLAFDAAWISSDGSTPTISTTVSTVNLLTFYVVDSTHVWFVLNTHGVA